MSCSIPLTGAISSCLVLPHQCIAATSTRSLFFGFKSNHSPTTQVSLHSVHLQLEKRSKQKKGNEGCWTERTGKLAMHTNDYVAHVGYPDKDCMTQQDAGAKSFVTDGGKESLYLSPYSIWLVLLG